MSDPWLILELNDIENLTYKDIENAVITTFGDEVEYFIPIHHEAVGTYTSTSVLIEGYVFVRDGDAVRNSIFNLREHRVFSRALYCSGRFQTVPSEKILDLKKKLKHSMKRKFFVGSKVKVLEGTFKNLVGEVIGVEENGKKIVVKIKRISREMIAPIPATLLEEVEDVSDCG